MKSDTLFLCSSSSTRQALLKEADIPFTLIAHSACEEEIRLQDSLEQLVIQIAKHKLASIINDFQIPPAINRAFFLSADTLVQGIKSKNIYKKPESLAHARVIIQELSKEPLQVTTGCTLALYQKKINRYIKVTEESFAAGATITFSIPEEEQENYLNENPHALYAAGATTIEGNGGQYLQSINGSYSGVLGLPLFEVKELLKKHNFKK